MSHSLHRRAAGRCSYQHVYQRVKQVQWWRQPAMGCLSRLLPRLASCGAGRWDRLCPGSPACLQHTCTPALLVGIVTTVWINTLVTEFLMQFDIQLFLGYQTLALDSVMLDTGAAHLPGGTMPPSAAPYALGSRFTAAALHTSPPPAQPVEPRAALQLQVSSRSAGSSDATMPHIPFCGFACTQIAVKGVHSGRSGACSCATAGGSNRR